MASRLESIPYDVLLNVAFFAAAGRVIGPPSSLSTLLLTSRTLYRELNVTTSPHLYSRLFEYQFDAPITFHGRGTSTSLAKEYVARHQLLRRSRLKTLPSGTLLQDLRCALRMVFESDGINEVQLAAGNFPDQLVGLMELHLPETTSNRSRELKCLLVWLLSLSLSRGDIAKISSERLEHLCLLLHRFATPTADASQTIWYSDLTAFFRDSVAGSRGPGPRRLPPRTPSPPGHIPTHRYSVLQPCFAAINVLFAMKEACPIIIPPHMPPPRAMAQIREFQNSRTPLFADAIPRDNFSASFKLPGRSRTHGPEFHRLFGLEEGLGEEDSRLGYPGSFSGLWRGAMMTESEPIDGSDGGLVLFNRQPLQARFRSYHCFSPNVPLPWRDGNDFDSFPFHPSDLTSNEIDKWLNNHHYTSYDENPSTFEETIGLQ